MDKENDPTAPARRRFPKLKAWQQVALGVGAAVGTWYLGDFVYSRVVEAGQRRWESRIDRDEHGVREGCQAFSLVPKGDPVATIMLVHGFDDTPPVWRPFAERLAAKGCHCRVIRLPGFGQTLQQNRRVTLTKWRDHLDTELNELREQAPDGRVWVVGHSLGGALSLDLALRRPDDVAGVIVQAPLLQVSNARSPLLTPRAWYRIVDGTLLFTRFVDNIFGPDLQDESMRGVQKRERYIPRETYRALFQLIDALAPRAPELQGPLLMFLASEDRVIDTPYAQEWFEACTCAKRLVERTGVGHVLPLDYGWEDRADETLRFIKGHQELADTSP